MESRLSTKGRMGSVQAAPLCLVKTDPTGRDGWLWLCVNKTLLTKTGRGQIWPLGEVSPSVLQHSPCHSASGHPRLLFMCTPFPRSSGVGVATQVRGVHSSVAADSPSR